MSKELEALEELLRAGGLIYEENRKDIDLIVNALQILELIKKYTYSGGWSGDYTTEYWKMKNKEIKLIDKYFAGVRYAPLSERR